LSPDEPLAVLRAADAVAVLLACGDVSEGERDRVASHALCAVVGMRDIVIGRRPSSRPRLYPPYHELGVSMSRRGGLLIAAFCATRPVGVDVELDSPALEPVALSADHFSTGEALAIAALPPPTARDVFLRAWVAKEAALKVTGRGIHDGVDEPDLSGVLDQICQEDAVALLQASARLPALHVVTRTLESDGASIYCALAVALAT
jgi:4'-phosphopantetheinyl transferase